MNNDNKTLNWHHRIILTFSWTVGFVFCPFCCRARWEEYRWDWQSNSVKQALLLGPPRNTGLICPLYVASREAFGDELQDVYAYALTTTEEEEEERLISKFDPFDKWVTVETQQDMTQCFQTVRRKHNKLTLTLTLTWLLCRLARLVEELDALKKQGNEAFKAGKADLAYVHYNQAQVPSGRFPSVTPIFVQ